MSITLSNGVVVPDIPTKYFKDYPFVTIFKRDTLVSTTVTSTYVMYMTKAIMGHVEAGVLAGNYSAYEVVGSIAAGKMCIWAEGTDVWAVGGQDLSAGEAMVPLYVALSSSTMQSTLLWSNHDILNITSIDMTTGAYRTGDVYFWKSGHENISLPPIPAELMNRYGFYGIVRCSHPLKTMYYLAGAPTPGAYVTPEQIGENYGGLFCKSKTGYISYEYTVEFKGESVSTDWELYNNPPYGNGWCSVGTDGSFTYVITDSNADIYYAATFDPDTEDVTYSSEIYFAQTIFDEVEKPLRVSIGRSLVNGFAEQAQRLTGTTDQMNAVVLQERLAAATAGAGINDNGVTVPDVPVDLLKEYPFAVVIRTSSGGTVAGHQLYVSKSAFFHVNKGMMPSPYSSYEIVGSLGAGKSGSRTVNESEWYVYSSESSPGSTMTPIGDIQAGSTVTTSTLIWANHDVYEVTSLDMTTGDYTMGDRYYPVFNDVDDERVSIGYDLFNDIVEQIQRLSNNEEKMNALRAYWKLTTVAAVVTVTDDNTNSGIVIDGVSFPDLPEVNFPYAFIAYHTAGYYYLQYSREPYYADYWKTNSTTANPYYKYSSTSVYYDENDGRIFRLPSAGIGVESIWADYTNESSGMALISYNNKNTQVVWSNYDIYFNYPDNTIAFHSSV